MVTQIPPKRISARVLQCWILALSYFASLTSKSALTTVSSCATISIRISWQFQNEAQLLVTFNSSNTQCASFQIGKKDKNTCSTLKDSIINSLLALTVSCDFSWISYTQFIIKRQLSVRIGLDATFHFKSFFTLSNLNVIQINYPFTYASINLLLQPVWARALKTHIDQNWASFDCRLLTSFSYWVLVETWFHSRSYISFYRYFFGRCRLTCSSTFCESVSKSKFFVRSTHRANPLTSYHVSFEHSHTKRRSSFVFIAQLWNQLLPVSLHSTT